MIDFIPFLVDNAQISQDVIILLLGLPFIGMIIGFARYYVGVKTFSLYTPLILTIAFYLIQTNYPGTDQNAKIAAGIVYGVLITILLIISTLISTRLYKKIRLHYFPKISLIFSTIIIIMLGFMYGVEYFGVINFREIDLAAFILIIIIFEKFVTVYSKKHLRSAIQLSIETILLALLCYGFISLEFVQNILLSAPWIIILALPGNYIIGKYSGLRLTEIFRFQDILQEENTDSNGS